MIRVRPPALYGLCLLVPLLVILGHAALLPQGQWLDEYFTFHFFQALGWRALPIRLTHWSFRPISESLACLYWLLVRATGRPWMPEILAFAWTLCTVPMAFVLAPWKRQAQLARLMLLLSLFALFLLAAAPVFELWFWPLGALAYLPALGAASAVVLAVGGPGIRTGRAWFWTGAALTAGAWSAEVGAFLALCFCPLLLSDAARRRDKGQAAGALVPLVATLAVLAGLAHGRVAQGIEMMSPAAFHQLGPSLRASLWPVLSVIFGFGAGASGVVMRLLLLAGSWFCFAAIWPAAPRRRHVVFLILSLAATIFLSVAAAFYQFGMLCCSRHDAYRGALSLLLVISVAALLPRRLPVRPGQAGALLLAAAIIAVSPLRIKNLFSEYRLADDRAIARRALFQSGDDPGAEVLIFQETPDGPLIKAYGILPGLYDLKKSSPWFVQGPMLFFGKQHVLVKAPLPRSGFAG